MNRKQFIKESAVTTASAALFPSVNFAAAKQQKDLPAERLLNSYYLRAHMYTLVPSQVREDMKWMAGIGTNIVSISVLEQDFYAAKENINILINEATKEGLKVFAIPGRWGGIVAGGPKVPSLFTIQNQQTWMMAADGKYIDSSVSGRISSIFHQDTFEFICFYLEKLIKQWPVSGIIWDEPKTIQQDFSSEANAVFGSTPSYEQCVDQNVWFYSKVNAKIKSINPNIITNLFIYAQYEEMVVNKMAMIENLDYYGCDGRPWRKEDGGTTEGKDKYLLGNGERFLEAAHRNGKNSLWVSENHNMQDKDVPLMDKRLPEILSKPVDQLIYFYYPRNLETPDYVMKTLALQLKKFN
jgi:hypothetical protein